MNVWQYILSDRIIAVMHQLLTTPQNYYHKEADWLLLTTYGSSKKQLMVRKLTLFTGYLTQFRSSLNISLSKSNGKLRYW